MFEENVSESGPQPESTKSITPSVDENKKPDSSALEELPVQNKDATRKPKEKKENRKTKREQKTRTLSESSIPIPESVSSVIEDLFLIERKIVSSRRRLRVKEGIIEFSLNMYKSFMYDVVFTGLMVNCVFFSGFMIIDIN